MSGHNYEEFVDSIKRGDVKTVAEFYRSEWIEKEDRRDIRKRRPIHWACIHSDNAIAELLVDKGCNIEAEDRDGWRSIHWACYTGHASIVHLFLDEKCNIEAVDKDKFRPIHRACDKGHYDAVQLLLERKCDIEAVDISGSRPIHLACDKGHVAVVHLLLERKCDIEAVAKYGRRPIHWACNSGHVDVVKLLLDRKCDIEAEDNFGWRPIYCACNKGHIDIVQLLLDRKCDIDAADPFGSPPIHRACAQRFPAVVKLLLDRKCDIEAADKSGWRLIHMACDYGIVDVVQWLLDKHCEVEAADKVGKRPIHWACSHANVTIVQLLFDRQCKMEAADRNGQRAIHFACVNGQPNVLQLLLDRNCDKEAMDIYRMRPIHHACDKGHENVVKLLLDGKCDMEAADAAGCRPIHIACANGHAAVVKLLLDRNCAMDAPDNRGLRPIHWACDQGHSTIVQLLLDRNCEIDAPDNSGSWKMHYACVKGDTDIIQSLLDNGCDMEYANKNGWRPIHWACFIGHVAVVQLFVNNGCLLHAKTREAESPLNLAKECVKSECARIIEQAQAERKKDEFQIFHLPTFSIVSRKYKIYDFSDVLERIKTEISCIKQPIVVCHLTDPLRRLLPSQKALRMTNKGLKYPEYFVEDASQSEDLQSRIQNLRNWDIRVPVNAFDSEINLEINKPVDSSNWKQYKTVRFDLSVVQLQPIIDTVHMLVTENVTGAEVKKLFLDFRKFAYCGELFKMLDENQDANQDGIECRLYKWITTQKKMFTFYDCNNAKLSNANPIFAPIDKNAACRISVVQKAPKQVKFILTPSKLQWSKESITEIVSQEYLLIRCITDKELAWAIPFSDCKTVENIVTKLKPLVLGDEDKGRLMLIGADEVLSDDTQISKLDSVIHYAVVLPKDEENVETIKQIGSGSFGVVSRCRIGNEETIYAMKKMNVRAKNTEDDIKSRKNEVIVAAYIGSHLNVLKYCRFYESKDAFCIVMDCMKENLYQYIRRNHPLEEEKIITFARQILEGLKHLHDQKVIHRDIKCKNVLLDKDGCIKLCDFGGSKHQNVDTDNEAMDGGNTPTGTIRYMAPELYRQDKPQKCGQKADVWGFGLMMVEMITGKEHSFGLTDAKATLQITKNKRLEYKFPSRYSKKLKEFVDSCLIYEPDDRPTCVKLLQNIIFAANTSIGPYEG